MERIVRAKEGCVPSPSLPTSNPNKCNSKMVNVNARLPFNLHHKNLSSITNTMDRHPWTSSNLRSASTSTPNRGRGLVLLSSTPHSHAQTQAHVGRPLTVVPPWRTWSQTHMLLDPGHLAWLLEAPRSLHTVTIRKRPRGLHYEAPLSMHTSFGGLVQG